MIRAALALLLLSAAPAAAQTAAPAAPPQTYVGTYRNDYWGPATITETDVPWRPIVLVGLALVVFYTVDTAAATWGPVYLDDVEACTVRAGGCMARIGAPPTVSANGRARGA